MHRFCNAVLINASASLLLLLLVITSSRFMLLYASIHRESYHLNW